MPPTDRKKNQLTTDMVQHCRDICIQKYTVFFFGFLFPCLSSLICFQRRGGLLVSFFRQELNHFHFQFRYLQNFLSLNQYANCVQSKSCKVRFPPLSRYVYIEERLFRICTSIKAQSFRPFKWRAFFSTPFRGKSRIPRKAGSNRAYQTSIAAVLSLRTVYPCSKHEQNYKSDGKFLSKRLGRRNRAPPQLCSTEHRKL